MKKIRLLIASIVFVGAALFVVAPLTNVGAVGAIDGICEDNSDSAVCQNKDNYTAGSFIGIIINALLGLVGAVCVVVIIIGGFQYATSAGNSANVAKAKNTILYALVGLVVSFIAFAIVNFVLKIV